MSRAQLPNLSASNYLALMEFNYLLEPARRYSLAVFTALFLLVTSAGIFVGAAYWSAHITIARTANSSQLHIPATPLHGPNAIVANGELTAALQTITSQPLSLSITNKTVSFNPDTIKGWIKIVSDKHKGVSYLHVNQAAVATSLTGATAPFVKAPTDQVTATYGDGSTAVIVTGRNGTQVHDTAGLAQQISDNLLSAKGQQVTVPTDSLAFAALTPANFDKLLETDVVTKQMWAYEKGQLVKHFAVSAGAPATPTPLGRFQIYQKLTVQDMRGFNTDGTKYLQPHVHWINYFLPGGYAVHGVYWHPLDWFGAINSSHGCVGLPEADAEWVYDWAPIGTTVITHA